MRRRRQVALVAIALSAVVSACASSSGRRAITIGSLYPLTGPQGGGGTEESRGVQLAAEWANAHGGVGGRRIQLVARDAVQAESVPALMASLKRRGVDVVVGSHGSAISLQAAKYATREDMLLWETGAVGETTPDTAGGRHFFRLAPMGANLGAAAIDFVNGQLTGSLAAGRPLRYAVAYVDDPYGRAVGAGALEAVRSLGLSLAGSFAYDAHAHEADFAAIASRIAAVRPDVLFVAAYLDDGVALRRAVVATGAPILANIGTSSSYCMPAFGDTLGADAVGLFASDKPDAADVRPEALRPEGRAALEWASAGYKGRWHEPMSAPALSGFANAYALFVHVLPTAGGTDAAHVAAAARRVKLPEGTLANGGGVDLAGPGGADPGANLRAAGVIWQWIAPGTRAVVWPPSYATHSIVIA